jgi:alanine-glyoxylate transaminase/serine-glyoxylate transaminase/serine-pyruvate transaminase
MPSFNPPLRVLMGPGPSDVHPRVLAAMARPCIGHLDPVFQQLMEEMKELLRYAFRSKNRLTMPASGPGSVGMETCFVNLVEPGDTVIVCQNGVFGGRMKENVERCGATAIMVTDDWGRAVDLNKVADTIKKNPKAKAIAFVHAETSTGARSDAEAICKLAKAAGMLTIVDAVTSLGGVALEVDAWGIDAIYSGSQKCLSCAPGLSPVSFSARAEQVIKSRNRKVQSWFMDMSLIMNYWEAKGGARTYHHTAPVNALYGLHEALTMLKEEGLEKSWERHKKNHLALRAGLEAMGLELLVPESERLPQLNAIRVPAGVDEAAVRKRLLADYNLEIGAGLGALAGKVWRIGLMGASSTPNHVTLCLAALESVLASLSSGAGMRIARPGAAVAAARGALYPN